MARAGKKTEKPGSEAMSGTRKAAILLMALDQEIAARLLKSLRRERVEEISREIAAIEMIDPATRDAVITEFYNLVLARQYADAGGLAWARTLLQKTLPPDEAKKIIAAIEHQVHEQPFSFLQKTETESLMAFLQEEHPQMIALVLSHVPPATASEILIGLPAEKQVEVIQRIAKMDQTSPEVIKEVERGLEKRLAGLMNARFERAGGVQAVAEILNLSGRAAEKTIMEGLEATDAGLVDEIRQLMFVFEDIAQVNDKGIQAVLKEVDNAELTLALKTASEELKEKIFRNMSERAAQLVKEEMEFMGPVRVADVEAAQKKVVDIVRRLEDAGEIIIEGRGGDSGMLV